MTYRVEKQGRKFAVIEKDTDLVLIKKTRKREAHDMCRNLNLGHGFNGWTPSFFAMSFGANTSTA